MAVCIFYCMWCMFSISAVLCFAQKISSNHIQKEYEYIATSDKCEQIRIPMCKDMPYNETIMPNLLNHMTQDDAWQEILQFIPLVKVQCSKQLKFFVCVLFVPVCTVLEDAIPPCWSLCNDARTGCRSLMDKFGLEWPEKMKCDQFPRSGLCVGEGSLEPPKRPVPVSSPDYSQADTDCSQDVRLRNQQKCFTDNGLNIYFPVPEFSETNTVNFIKRRLMGMLDTREADLLCKNADKSKLALECFRNSSLRCEQLERVGYVPQPSNMLEIVDVMCSDKNKADFECANHQTSTMLHCVMEKVQQGFGNNKTEASADSVLCKTLVVTKKTLLTSRIRDKFKVALECFTSHSLRCQQRELVSYKPQPSNMLEIVYVMCNDESKVDFECAKQQTSYILHCVTEKIQQELGKNNTEASAESVMCKMLELRLHCSNMALARCGCSTVRTYETVIRDYLYPQNALKLLNLVYNVTRIIKLC